MEIDIFSTDLEDLKGEMWVDAYGFDGLYEVSNLGRLKCLGRWVNNGKSQRFVKEKIRKLTICNKKNRVSCPISLNNKQISINLPALVYFSFNTNQYYKDRTECIIHLNKNPSDNRLCNLKLDKVSKSHTINHEHGLLNHLHNYNKNRSVEYYNLKNRICTLCGIEKPIEHFETKRKKCKQCRNDYKKQMYHTIIKHSN